MRHRRRIVPCVEETDDDANKVSQRPGARTVRKRTVNKFYLTGNYRLQGGNLQANWYNGLQGHLSLS